MDLTLLNRLTALHTAFADFPALIDAAGGYRPTLRTTVPDLKVLADAYDLVQTLRGDARRVARDTRSLADLRKPIKRASKPRGPSKTVVAPTLAALAAHPAVLSADYVTHWDTPQFAVEYRFPWISDRTFNAFDHEESVSEILLALSEAHQDADADAEWEDN